MNVLNAILELVRPLFDARLVLAVVIVVAATVLAHQGSLRPELWLAAVGYAVWWSGAKKPAVGEDAALKSRGLS